MTIQGNEGYYLLMLLCFGISSYCFFSGLRVFKKGKVTGHKLTGHLPFEKVRKEEEPNEFRLSIISYFIVGTCTLILGIVLLMLPFYF